MHFLVCSTHTHAISQSCDLSILHLYDTLPLIIIMVMGEISLSRSEDNFTPNTSPSKYGLEFKELCVDVADRKRILWNISGHAVRGHILAVMGPSGWYL